MIWYLVTFIVGFWLGMYLGNEKFRRKFNAALKPLWLKFVAYMKKKPSWKIEEERKKQEEKEKE